MRDTEVVVRLDGRQFGGMARAYGGKAVFITDDMREDDPLAIWAQADLSELDGQDPRTKRRGRFDIRVHRRMFAAIREEGEGTFVCGSYEVPFTVVEKAVRTVPARQPTRRVVRR